MTLGSINALELEALTRREHASVLETMTRNRAKDEDEETVPGDTRSSLYYTQRDIAGLMHNEARQVFRPYGKGYETP